MQTLLQECCICLFYSKHISYVLMKENYYACPVEHFRILQISWFDKFNIHTISRFSSMKNANQLWTKYCYKIMYIHAQQWNFVSFYSVHLNLQTKATLLNANINQTKNSHINKTNPTWRRPCWAMKKSYIVRITFLEQKETISWHSNWQKLVNFLVASFSCVEHWSDHINNVIFFLPFDSSRLLICCEGHDVAFKTTKLRFVLAFFYSPKCLDFFSFLVPFHGLCYDSLSIVLIFEWMFDVICHEVSMVFIIRIKRQDVKLNKGEYFCLASRYRSIFPS